MKFNLKALSLSLRFPRITERNVPWLGIIFILAVLLSVSSMTYYFFTDAIIAYGDAESHLNISKRVVHSLTPGMAQLGGIWLPLPHLMMVPFVLFDAWWRTGLAGSIVSGFCFIVSGLYLFKLTYELTKNNFASFFAFLVFSLNPNILYMQATPMTELPLIMFFILSSYHFIRYLKDDTRMLSLMAAAFFGFCATLSRYDGWFLVLIEAIILTGYYSIKRVPFNKLTGLLVFFGSLAFVGIALWMLWDLLILGDPFYFTNSQFSAKTQQEGWYLKGQLPSYHDPILAFLYYFVTAMSNVGVFIFFMGIIGFWSFITKEKGLLRLLVSLILLVPFIFYVVTLYVGQSIIFIPHLTPTTFEWTLFNVRYGLMMMPPIAIFLGYLFYKSTPKAKAVIALFFFLQFGLYLSGYSKIQSLEDGVRGLSSAQKMDAQYFLAKEYDSGLVLMDDYSRRLSVIRSDIPMQNMIYIGNKPYWEESLETPEKHAKWIIMQKNDVVWTTLYTDPVKQGRLYTYYEKVYTSPEILVFKKKTEDISYHEK